MPHIRQSSNRRRTAGSAFPMALQRMPQLEPAPIELGAAVMGSAPRRRGSNGACSQPCREPLRVLGPRNCCMLGCAKARRACSSARRRIRMPALISDAEEDASEEHPSGEISIAGRDNGRLSSPTERRVPTLRAPGELSAIGRDALAASTVTNGQIDRRVRPLPSGRRRRANRNTYTSLRPG